MERQSRALRSLASSRGLAGSVPIEVRLDGAFCQHAVVDFLETSGIEYTMWVTVDSTRSAFSTLLWIPKWKRTVRVVVCRKKISGKPSLVYRLNRFQPDDGFYDYSMVVTNRAASERSLWRFIAGRGGHEKTLGESKQRVAFAMVPTNDEDATGTWQLPSVLTHELVRDFQVVAGAATPHKNSRKRTCRWRFASLRTLRFAMLIAPGRIQRRSGRQALRLVASRTKRRKIRQVEERLGA